MSFGTKPHTSRLLRGKPEPDAPKDRSSVGAPRARTATRAELLTEAFVCELHTYALLTATVTSGVNALTDRVSSVSARQLEAFRPQEAATLSDLADLLRDAETEIVPLSQIEAYIAEIEPARSGLAGFLADAASLGEHRAGVLHAGILADSWRALCGLAIAAIAEADAVFGPSLPEIYRQNMRVLTGLLAGARNGWRPCFTPEGRLYTPPLPQQRRSPRHLMLQDCSIECEGQTSDGFVRDVSSGGMRLEQAANLTIGQALTISLQDGRQFEGKVAWTDGKTAGISFATPLPASRPLLTGMWVQAPASTPFKYRP